MRKRGGLTNNVLSLTVAVIGIGLIAYGIVKLYNVYSSEENKNALKTLENIKSKIDNLGDGQKADILIQGFKGGNNQYIVGYSKEEYERKPDKCYFESCICVCRGTSKESCQSGYCEEVEQEKVNVYT